MAIRTEIDRISDLRLMKNERGMSTEYSPMLLRGREMDGGGDTSSWNAAKRTTYR